MVHMVAPSLCIDAITFFSLKEFKGLFSTLPESADLLDLSFFSLLFMAFQFSRIPVNMCQLLMFLSS